MARIIAAGRPGIKLGLRSGVHAAIIAATMPPASPESRRPARLARRLLRALAVAPFWIAGLLLRRGRAIVFCYHDLDGSEPDAISRRSLRAHAALVRRRARRPVTLGSLAETLRDGAEPDPLAVALTFDDGYRRVAPALERLARGRGLPSTIFPLPRPPGEGGGLSPDALRALAAAGVEVGAHTLGHTSLPGASPEERRREISGSGAWIEAATGRRPVVFAYPYGSYDLASIEDVRLAGFRAACTCEPRCISRRDDPLALPRVVVGDFLNLLEVEVLLSGAAPAYLELRRLALGRPARTSS